ncbi:CaiB/BaiF CoA transferase family protein [Burkholderia lata]|uniref:CaiB/BaiF CoA transferase family protein n=1 Tax=Burkholderia lata (strain ATCC 17760 / DSM 23089 / LMG 22485 / NCIMB 9086 / R18194 / 383) TaxID=482957 RepID=UPI001452BA5E|nr:CoA transferase [Burkholderia lata]VWL88529.1 L-carnitine dehydratase [Burkholderia lata]
MNATDNMTANTVDRPLDGVRVLAVENFIAGPYASMWLADAGAEVVKVESREGGDFSRSTSPVKTDANGVAHGLSFLRSNRNKKSVTLDLKHPDGKRIFIELAREADIVVENLRPGVMDRLGIGYDVLREHNPRLIYVAISGFGHTDVKPSPYTDYPAFDIVGQAMSGLMYRPDRTGDRPTYLGFSLADLQGGILAMQGALLALYQRQRTGRGKKVDISLYDASLIQNEISVAMYSALRQPTPPGVHAVTAPFGTYRANDGYIVIAVLGEHIWRRFCDVIGRPELPDDPRFVDGISRRANGDALNLHIDAWLAERTRTDAVRMLRDGGVPASVVNDVADLFDCPHVAAREMLMTLDDPVWGPIQVAGNPIKMSDVPEPEAGLPPQLGQHTQAVLEAWLQMDGDEVAALRSRQVI